MQCRSYTVQHLGVLVLHSGVVGVLDLHSGVLVLHSGVVGVLVLHSTLGSGGVLVLHSTLGSGRSVGPSLRKRRFVSHNCCSNLVTVGL